jgi:hypothetical protein
MGESSDQTTPWIEEFEEAAMSWQGEPWANAVGHLKVEVVKGQGLHAADTSLFSKSSDPYDARP